MPGIIKKHQSLIAGSLIVCFVFGLSFFALAQDRIKGEKWQIDKPKAEIIEVEEETETEELLEEKIYEVEVLLEGDRKIAQIFENEILANFSELKTGFESLSLDLEASQPIAENPKEKQLWDFLTGIFKKRTKPINLIKTVKRGEHVLETSLTFPLRLKLKIDYQKIQKDTIKQSLTITNTSSEKIDVIFTLKAAIKGDTVIYRDRIYRFKNRKQILERASQDERSKSSDYYRLTFDIPSAPHYRGTYNWSDIQNLVHSLAIRNVNGKNFIELEIKVSLDPGESYIIDPSYGVDNEIVPKRGKNSKTYYNGDGIYTKEMSSVPIHYKDEGGAWQEIDTNIEDQSDDANFDYQCKNNNFQTHFKKNSAGNFVSFKINNSWIKHRLENNQSGLGNVNNVTAITSGNTITYPNVYDGVDLKYTISNNQLLEEFIVYSSSTASKINEIKQGFLVYGLNKKEKKKDENGEIDKIEFYNDSTETSLFLIPEPVMYEFNDLNEKNYGLHYEVSQSGANYFISKVLNQEGKDWLADPARTYPVIIDGTDTLYPSKSYWAWENTNSAAGYATWAAAGTSTETIFSSSDYSNVGTSNDTRTNVALSPSGTKYAGLHYSFDLTGKMTIATSTLTQGVTDAAACYDSTTNKFYIFGGYYLDGSDDPQYSSTTVQYDPSTDVATTTDIGVLPVQLRGHSCASKDANEMYIFGGYDNTNSQFNTTIYKFDPSSASSNAVDTTHDLPQGIEYAPAVYDSSGSKFYIFGGYYLDGSNNSQYTSEIVQYDTSTGVATSTGIGDLLVQLSGASAAYKDADEIYIFGGYNNSTSTFNANVYKFDPSSASTNVTDTGDDLPNGIKDSAAVYDSNEDKFYVFGGYYSTTTPAYLNEILEYSPGTNAEVKDSLPFQSRGMSAAFNSTNDRSYLFGGYDKTSDVFSDEILYYDPDADYDITSLSQIKYTHEGYNTGNAGKLYYYTDSAWTYDQDLATSSDTTLTKTITSGFTDYLDSENKFHFSAITEVLDGNSGNIYTDLVKLEVSYSSPPAFDVVPDDSSTGASPTNADSNVSFTGTAIDPDGSQWKIVVCKTAGVSGGACDGGSADTWATSTLVNSASEATATYTTTGAEGCGESCDWYAYACNSNDACSANSSANSPFEVNHKPSFSAISDDGPVESGATITFTSTASDTDTDTSADTVALLVCKGAGVSGTSCTEDTWCGLSSAVSSNASCTSTAPLLSGSNDYYAYIFDNHSLGATANGTSSSFTVSNAVPAVGTVTPGSVTLSEDTTATATSTGTVTDNNGYEDLSSVIAVFYDADATTNACPADANDCYRGGDVACATSSCSSLQCDFTCTSTAIEYYANAADWKWYVSAGDGTATGSETSASTTIATLTAIKLDLADITYGTVSLDATSTEKTIVATNTGNASPVDIKVSGTTMACDETGTLAIAQQHWNTTASQAWSSGETLTDTPAYTQLDIAQRTGDVSTGDIYWQLQIPATGYAGTCSGTNTFTASAVD